MGVRTTGSISNNFVYLTRGWVVADGDYTFTNNTWGTGVNSNVYDIAIIAGTGSHTTRIFLHWQQPIMAHLSKISGLARPHFQLYMLMVVLYQVVRYRSSPKKTIADGITRVVAGGTVNVAAGTYVEQVVIAKPLTLNGAGAATIIQSPASLTASFTTSAVNKPVVYIHDADNVTIQNLIVDGASLGNANYRFYGVAFYNAGGTIQNTTVKNIQDNPFSGSQHGNAIYAWDDVVPVHTINVLNNIVFDYQKNGITMNGSHLIAHVEGNTVTGKGTTAVTAQNGIQFGYGASGTLKNNTVTGNSFHLDGSTWDWGAAGILLTTSGSVTLEGGNTMSGNSQNLYIDSPTGPIALGAETFGALTGPLTKSYDVINSSTYGIDLSQSTFDGVNFSTATPAQILPFAGPHLGRHR